MVKVTMESPLLIRQNQLKEINHYNSQLYTIFHGFTSFAYSLSIGGRDTPKP